MRLEVDLGDRERGGYLACMIPKIPRRIMEDKQNMRFDGRD